MMLPMMKKFNNENIDENYGMKNILLVGGRVGRFVTP